MQNLYVLFRTKGQQNVDPFEYESEAEDNSKIKDLHTSDIED